MNKAKFMLPGLYEKFHVNQALIHLMDTNPDMFYDNIEIGAIYGNFQFCSWDGGRIFESYIPASYEKICHIRDFMKDRKIPLRLIYTNPEVKETDYYEHFNNLVTALCEDSNNELVVNSEGLESYLRDHYPSYKFISSTTKCKTKPEDSLKELEKGYYLVCLDYNLNKNTTFLERIPEETKPKVELLINAICPPGCPNRKEHYRLNGLSHLQAGRVYTIPCIIDGDLNANKTIHYHNNLTIEDINNYYLPNGFFNFKLEGRTLSDLNIICCYARYLVKPEYIYEFITAMDEFAKNYKQAFELV